MQNPPELSKPMPSLPDSADVEQSAREPVADVNVLGPEVPPKAPPEAKADVQLLTRRQKRNEKHRGQAWPSPELGADSSRPPTPLSGDVNSLLKNEKNLMENLFEATLGQVLANKPQVQQDAIEGAVAELARDVERALKESISTKVHCFPPVELHGLARLYDVEPSPARALAREYIKVEAVSYFEKSRGKRRHKAARRVLASTSALVDKRNKVVRALIKAGFSSAGV